MAHRQPQARTPRLRRDPAAGSTRGGASVATPDLRRRVRGNPLADGVRRSRPHAGTHRRVDRAVRSRACRRSSTWWASCSRADRCCCSAPTTRRPSISDRSSRVSASGASSSVEPGAGSDLASLTTRADRDGDEYAITGQKVWCSNGRISDWGICMARTDHDARPSQRHQLLSRRHAPIRESTFARSGR